MTTPANLSEQVLALPAEAGALSSVVDAKWPISDTGLPAA